MTNCLSFVTKIVTLGVTADGRDDLMDDYGLSASYEGHRVVDPEGATVGKVSKVIYDGGSTDPMPSWMVVDRGLLRSEHYVPATGAYATPDDRVIVPFAKRWIKAAPRADRGELTPPTRRELHLHYQLGHEPMGHTGS